MKRKMRWCDLFCGAGGAAMGIIQAGCDVHGVDIDPRCKAYYPGKFTRYDALKIESLRELDGSRFMDQFDAFWASPKCEGNSRMTNLRASNGDHSDQIAPIREILDRTGKPYIIENVPEAATKFHRMRADVELCGVMFGRLLYKHRVFEIHGFHAEQPPHPWRKDHKDVPPELRQKYSVVGRPVSTVRNGGNDRYLDLVHWWPIQMGITHVPVSAQSSPDKETGRTYSMFSLAIPPAFSKYLVEQCVAWIERNEP